MSKFCVKAGKLIDTRNQIVLENQVITVQDGRISSVEDFCEGQAIDYDFSDKTIMPSLINGHIHLGNQPTDEYKKMAKEHDAEYVVRHQLTSLIKSGVTCVRNVGSVGFIDMKVQKEKPNGIMQPEILYSGPVITSKGGHGSDRVGPLVCENLDECLAATQLLLDNKVNVVKIMATGGVMTKGTDLDSAPFSTEELKAMADLCKEHGTMTSVHAHGTRGIKFSAKAGISTIEHGTFIDDEGIEDMLKNDCWLVPTLAAPYSIKTYGAEGGLSEDIMTKMGKVYDTRMKNFIKCYKAGIKVAVGTDAGTPFNTYDKTYFELKMMCDLSIPLMDVLKIATVNTAEMLRISDDYGAVEKGKFADFIVLPENPVEKGVETIKNLDFVFKQGQIIDVKE